MLSGAFGLRSQMPLKGPAKKTAARIQYLSQKTQLSPEEENELQQLQDMQQAIFRPSDLFRPFQTF